VAEAWYQVRKKIGDMRHTLPPGVQGPFSTTNSATFITIFALTGDGFDLAWALRRGRPHGPRTAAGAGREEDRADRRAGRKDLHRGLARQAGDAGANPLAIFEALRRQNAMTPAGRYETPSDRVRLRVSGALRQRRQHPRDRHPGGRPAVPARRHRHRHRGFADPPHAAHARRRAQDAIGIGMVMNKGGDVIRLGDRCMSKPSACSRICRWASICTSSPTSRRSSDSR
jgi:multidrug efflux pump